MVRKSTCGPEYKKGLGYSPASGPKVGGPIMGPGNYFEYDINGLLPKGGFSFGGIPQDFYLQPDVYYPVGGVFRNYNPQAFPNLGGLPGELGSGISSGGIGGVNGPIIYGVNTLQARQMSYGTKKRRKRRGSTKKTRGRRGSIKKTRGRRGRRSLRKNKK